ncbi:acetyl/propionyl/methylcrotonyl-CoA carboxylase subunit alpha [Pleionea sp. CnH1-48]|uniref:acetyl/propionyl/methylcrotonyl-CoA carboxylase subunit alpha n=1 Tax=Pleionea sp. CnH1-48 TaxID=2954494 RepID=UPI002096F530|nr:acetyl/propionyl/methylcrotonyl-CoA carboxylase subunit alpha [Pleionea sp. CnH1-48]MCO7226844.1 acetyl/propionyl/methylcrotonyl-CoA carboxylase subunit alpha [Pleionea sp. CnH1-48]
MFEKILIANRGEIACRVIETAKRMGIKSVAVYSEADKNARHVAMADEAWLLGPAPAKESYLKGDLILEIAKKSGAQAIHPGYGFLSENADFSRACEAADIQFIGPPATAIDAMGSKSAAKEIMQEAGVPLVAGYHGENQDADYLQAQAFSIGYPVLIKATAGGGGKGMRVVWNNDEFADSLASCKREALASFGDDKVLVEKYLTKPRHVEIQMFADTHGNALHLFERDCSVQRRHQKVIEEAPAPGLTPEQRSAMGDVAVKAAKAIGYVGAGTVEFLFDEDGSFYFMEMNTRLQVEHPVTEKITGQDLVEWQLRVASGQPLPCSQDQLTINGHAFEARIYAEDPDQDFLPATGRLNHLATPNTNDHVRIDTGIRQGDEVSVHYDPMIAKLIVWDHDRDAALARLRGALADYQIVGLKTNLEFLSQLAAHDGFNEADLDTNFISRYQEELFPEKASISDELLAVAALYTMLQQKDRGDQFVADNADPFSPWDSTQGWRLNEDNHHHVTFVDKDSLVEYPVVVHFRSPDFLIELESGEWSVNGSMNDKEVSINFNGRQFKSSVIESGHDLNIFISGKEFALSVKQEGLSDDDDQGAANLTAPMPGTIISVMVNAGDKVESGQPLLVMEAMKMEHTIKAPADGIVSEVLYNEGDLVGDSAELVVFEAESKD